MTVELTAAPVAASHPYPPLTPDPSFYRDIAAEYAAMASEEKAALDRWEIAARAIARTSKGRHLAAVTAAVPVPASPVTVPDLPAPAALSAPHPPVSHRKPKERRTGFRRHARPEPPKRDQPPVRTEPVWNEPERTAGRSGATEAVPAAEAALDPLQAGRLERFNDAHDAEPPAGDWIDRDADRADREATSFFARPGDGRDATGQMTAVLPVPQQGERQ